MNSYGRIFRVSVFGESHGAVIGVVVDGVPAGIHLTENDFEQDLIRRKSGDLGTTPRIESDQPKIVSGVYKNTTTGAPLTVIFENSDIRSADYDNLYDSPRPGHADFTAAKKFAHHNDPRGGGHFSGRLTLSLVAAGVIAKKILSPAKVTAEILEIGGKKDIQGALAEIVGTGNSIGGVIQCVTSGLQAGLGEPFFDSIESVISHLAFSVPAIKGIEFGKGFEAARMKGSEHNDPIIDRSGITVSNHAGGVNGGISNGNDLVFRVAVKPASSIALPQQTLNFKSNSIEPLKISGRHDSCIALRIPVVIEAITAIALADFIMISRMNKL